MAEIMIARQSAIVVVDGIEVEVHRGVSTADGDSRIVEEHPSLWGVFPLDLDDEDEPTDAPSAKDVRAWAKAEGIDVPARGRIPDDVVERYRAAHAGSSEEG